MPPRADDINVASSSLPAEWSGFLEMYSWLNEEFQPEKKVESKLRRKAFNVERTSLTFDRLGYLATFSFKANTI